MFDIYVGQSKMAMVKGRTKIVKISDELILQTLCVESLNIYFLTTSFSGVRRNLRSERIGC